eukprot:scaffold121438_cov39-Cyclotella_meneghiniana.AAC.1
MAEIAQTTAVSPPIQNSQGAPASNGSAAAIPKTKFTSAALPSGSPPAVGAADSGRSTKCTNAGLWRSGPRPESQRRAAKWRQKSAPPLVNNQSHNSYHNKRKRHHESEHAQESTESVDRRLFPSTSELREAARFEQASNRVSKRTTIRDHFAIAKEIAVARRTEKSIDEAVRESLRSGGVGSIPNEKGNNIGRF